MIDTYQVLSCQILVITNNTHGKINDADAENSTIEEVHDTDP